MNIVVLVKQVPDLNAAKVDRGSGKPVFSGQMVVNSSDEHAVEQAIRLKEAHGGEVTIVSVGPASAKDAITRGLAMGADKGVHLLTGDSVKTDTLGLAAALAEALRGMEIDLLLLGQSSDDAMTGQIGPQLGELLGLPSVSWVTELSIAGNQATAVQDAEDGKQSVTFDLPAVVQATEELNEPRLPSLKGIMAAKKKPITQTAITIASDQSRMTWSDPVAPERAVQGTIVQDVPAADAAKQLVAWLKERKLV